MSAAAPPGAAQTTTLSAAPTGMPEYEPISDEFPGIADDDPAGSADAALDRLKALHLTAAAVAPQSLDAHFDQLLERQRKLISEYLSQTGGPRTPAATSAPPLTDDEAWWASATTTGAPDERRDRGPRLRRGGFADRP